MARRIRMQFPGARYHVINRGNYRQDVFASEGAWQAFVRTLGEAAERFRWEVHAYVVMSNHYHLALETPEPNLAVGMHWLQTTYATRHNRFRRRHGHLFQGRFKSLLIEDSAHLARVVDYLHLNPVRAKILSADRLQEYQPSSLGALLSESRPAWLVVDELRKATGAVESSQAGPNYLEHLVAVAGQPADDERMQRGAFSAGWAIGTNGWRKALARAYAQTKLAPEWTADELEEFRRDLWQQELEAGLAQVGKTLDDAATAPKTIRWKLEVADRLRQKSAAPYSWIARTLRMGAPSSVRAALTRQRQQPAG